MKNFLLRGIDPVLEKKIKSAAKAEQESVNQWILSTLRMITGIAKNGKRHIYHDLDTLAGGWDQSAAQEVLKNIACFEKVADNLFDQ